MLQLQRRLRWRPPQLLVAATVACLWLLIPAPAMAHAELVETNPTDGQVLASSPDKLTIRFSEPIQVAPQGTELLDDAGQVVPTDITTVDATVIITPKSPLADGSYILSWRVISADTHPVVGGITFAVGEPSGALTPVDSAGQREVNVLRISAEALRYGGVLAFGGLVWAQFFLLSPTLRRASPLQRRISHAHYWSAAAAAAGSITLIPLVAMWQDGIDLAQARWLHITAGALTEPTAAAAGVVLGGVSASLLGLHRNQAVLALTGAAVALSSVIIVGHTRTIGAAWLVVSADLVHVLAAAGWLGGLIALALILAPGQRLHADEVVAAVANFSTAAIVMVVGLTVAAVGLWWQVAGSLTALWSSTYGVMVAAKAAVVATVLVVAAFNKWWLLPRLQRRHSASGALLERLRSTVAVEAIALIVVVGLTAVLATQSPPPRPVEPDQITISSAGVVAHIRVQPGTQGTNSVQVRFEADEQPLVPAQAPQISVTLPTADVGPLAHTMSEVGSGEFEAVVDFPLAGTWQLAVNVRTGEFESRTLTTEVKIP